jgi:Spy/CpxP family protein refolding chaperone
MLKRPAFLLALLVFGMASAPAAAGDIPLGKWWKNPKLVQSLNLTEKEQNGLEKLFMDFQKESIELRGAVQKERLELESLLDQPQFQESDAIKRNQKLEEARSKLAAKRFQFLLDVRKTLGAERFNSLKNMFQARRAERMRQRPGGVRGGGAALRNAPGLETGLETGPDELSGSGAGKGTPGAAGQ